MKAQSGRTRSRLFGRPSQEAAEGLATAVFSALAGDPERLGSFLGRSGLDPRAIRSAAADPGFLAFVMDHVLADEGLLLAVADEIGCRPEDLSAAGRTLSPEPDWEP